MIQACCQVGHFVAATIVDTMECPVCLVLTATVSIARADSFIDNDPLVHWPDDGIHPNALGEQVSGDNLAQGLVAAFERGE